MAVLSQEAFDAAIQNQVAVERLKSSAVKKIDPFLLSIDRYIRGRLQFSDLTTYQTERLNKLLAAIRQYSIGQFRDFDKELTAELRTLGRFQVRWEAATLNQTIPGAFEAVIPTAGQITAAVISTPMSVVGMTGSPLVTPFIRSFNVRQTATIDGMIRQGVAQGLTNNEIIRNLHGTKSLNFKDGLFGGQMKRQADAMVRTAVQHVASVSRALVWSENKEIEQYQWKTTLDSRTCPICQGLSNEIFDVDKGPLPPAHPSCRCTVVFLLPDKFKGLSEGRQQAAQFGPVDSEETYYSWLKTQPAKFQDFAIGPTQGKLLRNGGLSADQFQDLRVDKFFKPLTLDQMETKAPEVFRKANVELSPAGLPLG